MNLSDIATQSVPATVEVYVGTSLGSGFLVHPAGLVITARHVVDVDGRSARSVRVRVNAGTSLDSMIDGTVFRSHRRLDYALIWLMSGEHYPIMQIGNPRALRFAETVLAIGCPSGLSNTVSSGIVANPNQRYRGIECIQTNADIDHGNSGGPLIAQDGVVGLTVWGLGMVNAARFAVPIDYLVDDIADAVRRGREACLAAFYCPRCGANDPRERRWYCRSCGVRIEETMQQANE